MGKDNEKKKKKRRLKREAEEVKNWEEEKLGNWRRRDFVAGKGIDCTKEYEDLVRQFRESGIDRLPGQCQKDFFREYKFNADRIRTINEDAVVRLVHGLFKNLYETLEDQQVRGRHWGMSSEVVLTHKAKFPDVLYQRVYKLLRMGEKLIKKPLAIGHWGAVMSYQPTKTLELGWVSEYGILSEVEALIESAGEVLENVDKTDNEEGRLLYKGEIILNRMFQIRDALLKVFIQPTGQMSDGRDAKTKMPDQEKKALMEIRGQIVKEEFYKCVRALGLGPENLVTELDTRPDDIKVDTVRGEVSKILSIENLNCQPQKKLVVNEVKAMIIGLEQELVQTVKNNSSKNGAKKLEKIENESKMIQDIITMVRLIAGMTEREVMSNAFALFARQSLKKLEKLVNNEDNDIDVTEYAKMTLLDLKYQYKSALLDSIAVATEETKANYRELLDELGVSISDLDEKVVDGEDVPELESCDSETEYEGSDEYERLGSFGILLKKEVIQYSRQNGERMCIGKVTQEKVDIELADELIEVMKESVMKYKAAAEKNKIILQKKYEQMEREGFSVRITKEIKTIQNETMRTVFEKEKGVNEIEELLVEINVGLEVQITRMEQYVKEIEGKNDPEMTLQRCKMLMLSATTTDVGDYIDFATLETKLERRTIKNLESITEMLIEEGQLHKAQDITGVLDDIKHSWTDLAIRKVEVFKKSSQKMHKLKEGKNKEPSEAAVIAAKWSDEINHYLAEKKCPEKTDASREMDRGTRELIEKDEIEELIRSGYYKSDEDTKKALKRLKKSGIHGSLEVIRTLRKSLIRFNSGYEWVAVIKQFEDFPTGYVKYCPANGKERVVYLERQKGRSTFANDSRAEAKKSMKNRVFKDKHPDECNDEEDLKGVAETCRNLRWWQEDEKVEKIVMLLIDVKEELDANSDKKFFKSLSGRSYGRYVQDKSRQAQESLSEVRAEYQAQVVHQNSDLRCYYANPNDEAEETTGSCGKGCENSRTCNVKGVYPGQKQIRCGQEFAVLAGKTVSAEELLQSMEGFISFGGNPATVQQRVIAVEDVYQNELLAVVRPYTEVCFDNIDEVESYFNEMVQFPEMLDGYAPRKYGVDDQEFESRNGWAFRIGCLVVPGWVSILVWLVCNALIENGGADSRVAYPKWNGFFTCDHCLKTFMSPIALLMHKIYVEDALGWKTEDGSVNHEEHGEYTVCWCRLVKNWKELERGVKEESDGDTNGLLVAPPEPSIVKEGRRRNFGLNKKVQLATLAYGTVETCSVGNLVNAAVLMNQMSLFCKIPGDRFAKRNDLALNPKWSLGGYWSNMYVQRVMREEEMKATKFMPEEWKMPRGTNVRLDNKGRVVEVGIRRVFSDFVECSRNVRLNNLKFGSTDNRLNDIDYSNDADFARIEFVVERESGKVDYLKNFISILDEIIVYNIASFLKTPKNEDFTSETFRRKILLGRYIIQNFASACTVKKKLLLSLFKMSMRDTAPFVSLKTPMGMVSNVENSQPKLLGPEVLNFNKHPVTGEEIVPGENLKMILPPMGKNVQIEKKVVGNLDSELDKILTKGWGTETNPTENGVSTRRKKMPELKGKGVKVKTTFVEETGPSKVQSMEKTIPDNENILMQIEHWRCSTCAPLSQRIPSHRKASGCFDSNPKNKRIKIRADIEKRCIEAKAKRIAEEESSRNEDEDAAGSDDVEGQDEIVENVTAKIPKVNKSVKELIEELENIEDGIQQRETATEIHKKVKKEAKEKLKEMKLSHVACASAANVVEETVEKPKHVEGEDGTRYLMEFDTGANQDFVRDTGARYNFVSAQLMHIRTGRQSYNRGLYLIREDEALEAALELSRREEAVAGREPEKEKPEKEELEEPMSLLEEYEEYMMSDHEETDESESDEE